MQFKHPELLYALFLLLIPIFIHLFQLRRFQKIDFTNVAFLQKVTIETRKSSQLKKWLTLLMRLAALACIILAFAQPFTASKTALNTEKETVLYIDNSFSLQAKGSQGPLLQRALQDLFANASGTENIHWFTNTNQHKNASLEDFKNDVLSIPYTQEQLSASDVLLKATTLFSKNDGADKRLLYISDFQQQGSFPDIPEDIKLEIVQLQPVSPSNISIDSAYFVSKSGENAQLNVKLSKQGTSNTSVPVSLRKGANLVAKTAADFSANTATTLQFALENPSGFNGVLELSDTGLNYDNTLYFNINTPNKIKVLVINQGDASFLRRMFEQEEFNYTQQSHDNLNYSDIPEQNFIVLNELEDIPTSLTTALQSFASNGGSVLLIPSVKGNISSYNVLLNGLSLGSYGGVIDSEKKITQIIFSHPLYENVFEKQVANFQYPKVNSFFNSTTNASVALRFEDGKPFVLQRNNTYAFTASIATQNSNFQSSPLIVPTLYNMAQRSLPLPELYYTIGQQNTYAVAAQLVQDEILTLKDSVSSTIPLQQTKANSVEITTTNTPENAGTYRIEKDNNFIENVSYNFSRRESNLQYISANDWEGARVYDSIPELFDSLTQENAINSFWKWFVIFAVLFLIFEMLILKYYK